MIEYKDNDAAKIKILCKRVKNTRN